MAENIYHCPVAAPSLEAVEMLVPDGVSSANVHFPPVALTPEVVAMVKANAAVAIGVSGGKDSDAVAIATCKYLDAVGHTGPRVLVHSDLGVVEWKASLPQCERLAEHLGVELLVVRRKAGDMLHRWVGRWTANVERYANLSCVKLILPWSTPSMRFCTSELKNDVIAGALKKRFPGVDIVNVTGVRREESAARSKMPVSQVHKKLIRKDAGGITWNAIIEWPLRDVLALHDAEGLPLHEAYTSYGVSRVSCVYCIMSSEADLHKSAACPDNQPVYRDMVDLELASTFAFQGNRWLADVAPHLLRDDQRQRLPLVKEAARVRQALEATIPAQYLYVKGWPTIVPTLQEAALLADVRRRVAAVLGIQVGFTDPDSIVARYEELLREGAAQQVATAAGVGVYADQRSQGGACHD